MFLFRPLPRIALFHKSPMPSVGLHVRVPTAQRFSFLHTLIKSDDADDSRFLIFIGDAGPNPEEILIDRERVADLQDFFLNHLSRLEQQTVLLFMQRLRYQQIADFLVVQRSRLTMP